MKTCGLTVLQCEKFKISKVMYPDSGNWFAGVLYDKDLTFELTPPPPQVISI
jgi:hypothetical protein